MNSLAAISKKASAHAELVDGDKAFTSICDDCTELLKLLVQMHRAFLWYNKNRCLLPRLYPLLVYAD